MKRRPETSTDCDMCIGNRQLLQQLLADVATLSEKMTAPEPLRINVIDWRDGDTLILTAQRRMCDDQFTEIAENLERRFPGHKALLLDDGMQIGVLRQDGQPE